MRQPVPFGKYLLLDRVSVGGMAEVFKAKSYGVEGFEKIIAIKRILPTMGEDRDFIKMFIDEAKIAGQLAHANICQIFELGRIDGSHFIAMEYIWGKDLLQIQNRLRKIKHAMPVAMACFVIAKVLEGLDYAHRKRDPLGRPLEIVHRDCSPQNVLVSYEGEVKVIDFGIAKATSRNSRTMAGVLKGKFGYMSPEQVRGLPLDRRSDLFALGTMLYECLTGERLFQGETDFSTLEKVRNVDIRRPRELNPDIPEVVEKVILKALAKDVDERYQWCSEMLVDLQHYLMSQDVVFTAKSLSSWLKDVFTNEIGKERQQLEQYKRVGRDGLIAGLPSADAKLDVDEHLGEAAPAEGDATQLGGPSFEDLEQAVAASAALEVGPAPGSPAVLGSSGHVADGDDNDDFGEEAPTEIFGEINHGAKPLLTPAPMPSPPVVPRSSPPERPANRPTPPKAPPGHRPPTPAAMPLAAVGNPARTQVAVQVSPMRQPPEPGQPQGYQHPQQIAAGTPQLPLGPQQGQPAGRTLLGAALPPGIPGYLSYPPGHVPHYLDSNPQVSIPPIAPSPQPYSGPYPSQPHHSHPHQLSNPQLYVGESGYPSQQQAYSNPQLPHYQTGQQFDPAVYPQTAVAVDHRPVVEGRKRSSIGRDVAIGLLIAAIVLGGFLAVKFLILDRDDPTTTGVVDVPATSSIATLRIEMPTNATAGLFLDDGKDPVATVKHGDEIPVTAGQRTIKIRAASGRSCEQALKLEPGTVAIANCAAALTEPELSVAKAPAQAPAPAPAPAAKLGSRPVTRPARSAAKDKMPPEDNPADKAAAVAGTRGFLIVTSTPSARISIDGTDTGQSTPLSKVSLPPGKHRIVFAVGGKNHAFLVAIKPGETTKLHKDL